MFHLTNESREAVFETQSIAFRSNSFRIESPQVTIQGGNLYVDSVSNFSQNVQVAGEVNAASIVAGTKNFLIAHPSNPNMTLRYGSLESPYHGIRLTGKHQIDSGIGHVTLPSYIKDLVDPDSVTIQLTNFKHENIMSVYSVDLKNDRFTVTANRHSPCDFFWSFTATRKDVPELVVEELVSHK